MPVPAAGEILIEISACGVCRTDLHVVDGDLPDPKLPIVPGHESVGRVAACGAGVSSLASVRGWLAATCGSCPYCRDGRENLCDQPFFTGYTRDGGFATHTVTDASTCRTSQPSLPNSMGGTPDRLGRQPHARGRPRIS